MKSINRWVRRLICPKKNRAKRQKDKKEEGKLRKKRSNLEVPHVKNSSSLGKY